MQTILFRFSTYAFIVLMTIQTHGAMAAAADFHVSGAANERAPQLTLSYEPWWKHGDVNPSGEDFGDFPSEGREMVIPVEEIPIATPSAPRYVVPIRIDNTSHQRGHVVILGDLYLADDRHAVAAEAAELLAATAVLLEHDPGAHLTLEAYCDDRGTEAYSAVTGEDWLRNIARRLNKMRIQNSRVTTVSYGLQQPRCTDVSSSCRENNLRMKWSMRLLSPIEPKHGCLIRFKLTSTAPERRAALIAAAQPYLRRIQQAELSTSLAEGH